MRRGGCGESHPGALPPLMRRPWRRCRLRLWGLDGPMTPQRSSCPNAARAALLWTQAALSGGLRLASTVRVHREAGSCVVNQGDAEDGRTSWVFC